MVVHALPFFTRAEVFLRPDTVLHPIMPLSVWPAPGRVTATGVQYDHEGEAPRGFLDDLRRPNVVLRTPDDDTFVVVDAQDQAFVPHIVLRLRRTRPTGA